MPMKRRSSSAQHSAKRGRKSPMGAVVNTINKAECLPANLRSSLTVALPIALGAYKSDRHPYENEVVGQGAQALKAAESALKASHQESVTKQNAVIGPAEAKGREAAKAKAAGHLQAVKGQVEERKAARKAAEKNVGDAEDALKDAQKDAKASEKELKRVSDKKNSLSDALTNDFALAQAGGKTAAGQKATKKLVAIGREFGLDGTLLQTLPMAAKKAAEARSEFEGMVFANLRTLIEGAIGAHATLVADAEAVKAGKDGAVAAATGASQNAKAALEAAEKALSDKQDEAKTASKDLSHADAHLRHIWEDMRKVCDHQDELAAQVQNFGTEIWVAFNNLKEQEAPPPEPEPVAEEAAPEVAAEAPAQA